MPERPNIEQVSDTTASAQGSKEVKHPDKGDILTFIDEVNEECGKGQVGDRNQRITGSSRG